MWAQQPQQGWGPAGGLPPMATLSAGCTPVTLFGERGFFVPQRLTQNFEAVLAAQNEEPAANGAAAFTPPSKGKGKGTYGAVKGMPMPHAPMASPYGAVDPYKGKGKGKGKPDFGPPGNARVGDTMVPNPGLLAGEEIFHGIVKTEVTDKHGYGFLTCPDVAERWGRDPFLHVKRCPWVAGMMLRIGEAVDFNMMTNEKGEGLVAAIIRQPAPQPENPGLTPGEEVFEGVVKTTMSEKHGYGFLTCPPVAERWGRDPFLHVKRCPWVFGMDLQIGNPVQFNMMTNEKGEGLVSAIVKSDGLAYDPAMVGF